MATVTNESHDRLEVRLFGLIFEPGETREVDDEEARALGWPFKVEGLPAPAPAQDPAPETTASTPAQGSGAPAAPVDPSATVEQPDAVAAAQAEIAKGQADLAAAEAAAHETPEAPAGSNAQ